ncbi:GGDEF domain-containing protein [Desulfospira joergensenii]|uniref:GGDEF domain-containing protein n=1 Tax=Desulfospira joergensenii TaxID=53329 RepID=UPI0003B58628|nr:GGDEF domain-containing protein [Desulfospira joergensenii]
MDKIETDAKHVLNQLGELSSFLASAEVTRDIDRCFEKPIQIMQKTMSFDVSVLYKVTNAVEEALLLKIVQVSDPDHLRKDLYPGRRFQLDLKNPHPRFVNEVKAFQTRKVSCINVPGDGCDIMGFVYLPETFGGGYLFGGDFCGKESRVKDYEASVCEIICNYLSTILIKSQFEELAINDSLTGLFNSRKIKEEAQRICNRFRRKSGTRAAAVLCDIDHFKKINDTWGHLQGDVILREVGDLLKSSMRENFDVAGRYGGEEFLMLFEASDMDTAFSIVERIREKIADHRFTAIDPAGLPDKDRHISITVSMGIAENRAIPEALTREEWISRADRALYRSKETGRNRTTVWAGELEMKSPEDEHHVPDA